MKFAALALIAGIAFAAVPASAHLHGGVGFFSGDAKPERMYPIPLQLNPNERTTITVTGDGKGDIDCYLYQGSPKHIRTFSFVTRDTSNEDKCTVTVDSVTGGLYTLMVQDTSDHPEHFTGIVD